MKARCPCCGEVSHLGARVGFKVGMMALPMLVGPRALKSSPWTSALVLLGAVWLGHQLDEAVLPSCPTCKVVLEKFV